MLVMVRRLVGTLARAPMRQPERTRLLACWPVRLAQPVSGLKSKLARWLEC